MTDMQFDVVIVGAGLAGLAAANRCAERGLSVALLERGSEERYLCNSRYAMGFVNVAMQEIARGPDTLLRAIDGVTRGHADRTLARALAQDAGAAVAWLRAQDIQFIRGGYHPAQRMMLAPPVPMHAGLNWPGRGADVMVRRLGERLLARGGQLLRGVRARELIMHGAHCVGVAANRNSETPRFDAGAVVLADGGFQADLDLVGRYITPRPDRLLQRNAGTGGGDGLRMALAVGARTTAMDRFYGHVQSRDAMTNPRLWPYPTVDFPLSAGIAVNARGERFVDEGLGGVYLANAIAHLDDPLESFAVFDEAIWQGRARDFLLPTNPYLPLAGGTMHRAGTLIELAEKAGLPAPALVKTVAHYNEAVDGAAFFDPARTSEPLPPEPIRQPPFYAVPLCAGITYTMGGIAIDDRCRVQHENGGTIPGLYAVGSTTGGHEGGPYAGYTGGLSKALVFGLRAADCIADAVPHEARTVASA